MRTPATARLNWFKSSRSAPTSHCVEVAVQPETVFVRDSKDAAGPVLRFAAGDWSGFIAGVRGGEFDRPAN
jgi:hypothetical protein